MQVDSGFTSSVVTWEILRMSETKTQRVYQQNMWRTVLRQSTGIQWQQMSQQAADGAARLGARLRAASRGERARRSESLVALGLVASLAYYYVVPSPLIALPGLLCFAVFAWLRLDLALCLLPSTFPFWYVPKRVVGHVVFPLSEIALGVCTVVVLLTIVSGLPRTAYGYPHLLRGARAVVARLGRWLIAGAALLFVGTALGVLIARRPHEALRAWRWEIVEPLLYLLLVTTTVRSARMARWLVWSLLGSALLLAILAAVQVFWLHVTFAPIAQGNAVIPYATPHGGVPRATAFIYGSGNSLGAWLARALPLALALAMAGGGKAGGNAVWFRGERLAAALCCVACLPALIWSASRGAWIAAGLACLVVLCIAWRRIWPAMGVAVAGVLVALWQRETIAAFLLMGHGGSGEVRTLVWLAAWHMIRDHALLGIGPDQFLYYYSNRYTSHPYWIAILNGHTTLAAHEPDLAHPHNLVLDLWLSGGILALVGVTVALVVCWRRCLRVWRSAHMRLAVPARGWYAAAALGTGGLVLAGVLHGLVDSGYFAPDLALVFWWAVAVVIVIERGVPGRGSRVTSTRTEGAHHGET